MKRNKIYTSLIEKSIGSMVSAIEIYNKPDFKYREEKFAILAINAWELIFKARLLKLNGYKPNTIYAYKPYTNKDGRKSTKKKVLDRNRTGNPKSISIIEAMRRLVDKKELPSNLQLNVEALLELRDNSIHFFNTSSIQKQVQELGFACIKNFIAILKRWQPKNNLHRYNMYLMPLAYLDGKVLATGTMTKETQNFLSAIKLMMNDQPEDDDEFDIAIRIKINMQKGNSFDGSPIQYSKDGTPITLSEEDIRQRFPWTYKDVIGKARQRYADFKQNRQFNKVMAELKAEGKLCFERHLDSHNPKSQRQMFYSTNVWQKLDVIYTKRTK